MDLEKNIEDAVGSYVNSLEEEQRKEIELSEGNISGMETIAKKLKKIISQVCIGEKVSISTDLAELKFSVQGEDLSIAIGRDGKNMAALEYIINLIGLRKKLIDHWVTIDIKDYRKNKIIQIKKYALEMADKAIKEDRKITLKPMCSSERKAIHNALARLTNVSTKSSYEEPDRRVIIYPEKGSK